MKPFPIAALDPQRGNSAAGHDRPTPVTGRASLTPRELHTVVAFRLGVTRREAELLLILGQSEVAESWVINRRMKCDTNLAKVHISHLRRKGWVIHCRHSVGYYLELADRQRVMAAAHEAPPGALPSGYSSLDSAGASAPAPFQSEQHSIGQNTAHIRTFHP